MICHLLLAIPALVMVFLGLIILNGKMRTADNADIQDIIAGYRFTLRVSEHFPARPSLSALSALSAVFTSGLG